MFVELRVRDVRGAGAVALLAADIPFGRLLGRDVVVRRMAAVAERPRRPLHLIVGVMLRPPIRADIDVVLAPRLRDHVPLHAEHVVVVAALDEIALLPLAAVDERDVLRLERHEWVRVLEVAEHGFGMLLRIDDHVSHPRRLPALVLALVAILAGRRAGIAVGRFRGLRVRGAREQRAREDGSRRLQQPAA